ncbi:NAD-dependent epimerase/dehydratase family protein [Streptomyces sp. NPDC048664]|uniref:NAD-dependent epimerase/dehydratase family protein n=1 Tax=Streptomyces sp. NPDC048664 TaxID=3154505 RepID=UPI0034399957
MPTPTILITGASGFIGGHVVREARQRGAELSLMTHLRRPPSATAPGTHRVHADLADPDTLRGVCDGIDVLIHCASRIGGGDEANEAVNARGTRALVAEAERAGVRRIVQLSTASVYGRGTFRGSRPEDLRRRPGSATSRTRAAAEDAVTSAGGVVLRPHLVYGEGDRWVGAGLARILRVLPGTVAGWTSRMSMISAPDLARLLVSASLAPRSALPAPAHHAVHPEPVRVADVLRTVADCAGIHPPGEADLTVEEARAILAENGVPASALDLLTTDHVFEGAALWSALRQAPGDGFHAGFRHAEQWYRTTLRTQTPAA